MVDVEIWYYTKSEGRVVRFSRNVTLSAAPFPGSYVSIKNDNLKIGEVTFNDGGGIITVVDNGEEDGCDIRPDSEINDFIEEMKEMGWVVLSDVKRKKGV